MDSDVTNLETSGAHPKIVIYILSGGLLSLVGSALLLTGNEGAAETAINIQNLKNLSGILLISVGALVGLYPFARSIIFWDSQF